MYEHNADKNGSEPFLNEYSCAIVYQVNQGNQKDGTAKLGNLSSICVCNLLEDLPPNKEALDWNTRIKIAVGAAKELRIPAL
ncbi:non-specific serine/threonine protein kinase [Ranunculus cassubicifolius]